MNNTQIITAAFFVSGQYLGTIHARTHDDLNQAAARIAAQHAPAKCHIEIPFEIKERSVAR